MSSPAKEQAECVNCLHEHTLPRTAKVKGRTYHVVACAYCFCSSLNPDERAGNA